MIVTGTSVKKAVWRLGTLNALGLGRQMAKRLAIEFWGDLMRGEGVTHSQQQSHIGSDPRPVPAQSGSLERCEGGNHRASHRTPQSPWDTSWRGGDRVGESRKEHRIACCTLLINLITV